MSDDEITVTIGLTEKRSLASSVAKSLEFLRHHHDAVGNDPRPRDAFWSGYLTGVRVAIESLERAIKAAEEGTMRMPPIVTTPMHVNFPIDDMPPLGVEENRSQLLIILEQHYADCSEVWPRPRRTSYQEGYLDALDIILGAAETGRIPSPSPCGESK